MNYSDELLEKLFQYVDKPSKGWPRMAINVYGGVESEFRDYLETVEKHLQRQDSAQRDPLYKAKRLNSDQWVEGFFTKKKIGNLIVPVIECYKECDSGDYMESYEIDGETLIQI